jgi:hypothetical protein
VRRSGYRRFRIGKIQRELSDEERNGDYNGRRNRDKSLNFRHRLRGRDKGSYRLRR